MNNAKPQHARPAPHDHGSAAPRVMSFAFAMASASVLLTSCHPPDREIYEESKNCVGVFDVAMKTIPHDELRKAGLYSDDVQRVAVDEVDAALKFGTNAGIPRKAIFAGMSEARKNASQTYGSGGTRTSAKLIAATKACMPKPEGPND